MVNRINRFYPPTPPKKKKFADFSEQNTGMCFGPKEFKSVRFFSISFSLPKYFNF